MPESWTTTAIRAPAQWMCSLDDRIMNHLAAIGRSEPARSWTTTPRSIQADSLNPSPFGSSDATALFSITRRSRGSARTSMPRHSPSTPTSASE